MNRRPRRSGIKFIQNDRDRSLTYFKRRSGLYKSITDLSTLTGAKAAVVVEGESGKIFSFGSPSANAVVECFLSNSSPANIYVDEAEMARITYLQDELFHVEKEKTVEEKRVKESKARVKKIEETSRVGKLLFQDVEKLGAGELSELLQHLARVQEDIDARVYADQQVEVSGQQGDPSLPAFSSSSWLPQINMPPRHLPWVPLHASSSLHPQSPWGPFLHSSMSYSSLLPPAHIPPPAHTPAIHHQAPIMPLPPTSEAHQYGYYFPQEQPLPQADLDPNYAYAPNVNYFDPVVPLDQNPSAYIQNFNFNPVPPLDQNPAAYACNFYFDPVLPPQTDQQAISQNFAADGQPPDGVQWTPTSPGNEYYNYQTLYVQMGLTDDNGVQAAAAGGDQEHVPVPSDGLHQEDDDGSLTMNLWDYSPFRGENPGGGAGN